MKTWCWRSAPPPAAFVEEVFPYQSLWQCHLMTLKTTATLQLVLLIYQSSREHS